MSPFRIGKRKAGEANRVEEAPEPKPTAPVRVPEVKKSPKFIDVKKVVIPTEGPMRVEGVSLPEGFVPEAGEKLATVTVWFKVNGCEFQKGDTILAPASVLAGWGVFLKVA